MNICLQDAGENLHGICRQLRQIVAGLVKVYFPLSTHTLILAVNENLIHLCSEVHPVFLISSVVLLFNIKNIPEQRNMFTNLYNNIV